MNNFKIICKILWLLDKHKGDEAFDYQAISAAALKVPYHEWEQLLILMQEGGYIKGLIYKQGVTEKFAHILEPAEPQITLKGMEYLAENNMMAKAKEALRLLGDVMP